MLCRSFYPRFSGRSPDDERFRLYTALNGEASTLHLGPAASQIILSSYSLTAVVSGASTPPILLRTLPLSPPQRCLFPALDSRGTLLHLRKSGEDARRKRNGGQGKGSGYRTFEGNEHPLHRGSYRLHRILIRRARQCPKESSTSAIWKERKLVSGVGHFRALGQRLRPLLLTVRSTRCTTASLLSAV